MPRPVNLLFFITEQHRADYLGCGSVPPQMGTNPAGSGPASRGARRYILPAAGVDVEEPEFWQSEEEPCFPNPYYGFDHVALVTDRGDQPGGAHLRWFRQRLGEPARSLEKLTSSSITMPAPRQSRAAPPEDYHSTAYIRDRAIGWLETQRASNQPFFGFVSFPDPHDPRRYWGLCDPEDMTFARQLSSARQSFTDLAMAAQAV